MSTFSPLFPPCKQQQQNSVPLSDALKSYTHFNHLSSYVNSLRLTVFNTLLKTAWLQQGGVCSLTRVSHCQR